MRITLEHRILALALAAIVTAGGCRMAEPAPPTMRPAEREAIADSLRRLVERAYDLEQPDVVAGFLSLYPDTGRVVSAAAGRVTTSRDSLASEIRAFWDGVGRNMQDPEWFWEETWVDVLSRDAAVLTTRYRVPHHTPEGAPHSIGGAWTAVFTRRDGRWAIVQEHLSDVPADGPGAAPPVSSGEP
ncbi:MAG TPA: DUF4440 domain-containing protein [Gemmatimonadaceae bacterium]